MSHAKKKINKKVSEQCDVKHTIFDLEMHAIANGMLYLPGTIQCPLKSPGDGPDVVYSKDGAIGYVAS